MSESSGHEGSATTVTDEHEIAHYDATTSSPEETANLQIKIETVTRQAADGALPLAAWLDTRFDSVAQQDVISHLLPVLPNAHVLQIGGTGLVALKALVAGARSATLVTPSQGELDLTARVAREFGLSDRLTTINAFAERLPLDDGSVNVVISEASMHHTDFPRALAEIARVLAPGGRFGCFEPWRAPLYGVGTKLLGKRDPGVHCRPLESHRIEGMMEIFPGATITWHGALTRYLLIALSKFGVPVTRRFAHRVTRIDDALLRVLPRFRRVWGSSVSIVATKM